MVHQFLQTLCDELSLSSFVEQKEKKSFLLQFSPEVELSLFDLHPGVSMSAAIDPCSAFNREDLFVHLMSANLLGQGTGRSRIGLDIDEKSLTLSLGLPYEMDYKAFKDAIEEFINHLIFWRVEMVKFEARPGEGFYK